MQSSPQDRQPGSAVQPSYRELRRAQSAAERRWKIEGGRKGILGAWLDLAAPPPASALATLDERERLRKAELSAYVAFGVMIIGLALIPNGLQHSATLVATAAIFVAGAGAAFLNRANFTRTAAVILITVFFFAIGGAMAGSPTLDLMWMPALDFFAVPVFLSGLLLSRRAPFGAALVGSVLVAALLVLKPRDPGLGTMVHQLGVYHFMVRPIALMVIVAIASWLWGRSVEQAIMRADRAEEVAVMEHQLADQKRQLDRGIQNLLETHVRVSNGDFSARAATNQDNVLWQIAVSLNTLVNRLAKYGQVEQRLQRTEAEIDRVVTTLEHARQGRPIFWPALSGTRVDRLAPLLVGHMRTTVAPPTAGPAMAQPTASAQPLDQVEPHYDAPFGVDRSAPTGGMPRVPTITGEWREITQHQSGHARSEARSLEDRETDMLRPPAPWAPQAPHPSASGPVHSAPHSWQAGPLPPARRPNLRREPPAHPHGDQPAPSARSAPAEHHLPQSAANHWSLDPLPPLPSIPDLDMPTTPLQATPATDATSQAASQAANATAPGNGRFFSESFPGQIRDGATWEKLRNLEATSPASDPHPEKAGPDSDPLPDAFDEQRKQWPDWPSFLRPTEHDAE